MSLLSRRKPFLDSKKKARQEQDGSLSQRKEKPRRFQISKTTTDYPVLGSGEIVTGSSSSGSFSLLSSSSSSRATKSKSKSSAPFISSSATEISAISSTGNLYSLDRSKIAEQALASSKLSTLTSTGPLEATPQLGLRKIKRMRRHEKSLTKGSAWFNMAKAEITKEKKNDLEALKLRSAMDGILHYKRNNITHTPKYFHVGTIVETSADFYSSRIPKKQRKKTLAQEFAAEYDMA